MLAGRDRMRGAHRQHDSGLKQRTLGGQAAWSRCPRTVKQAPPQPVVAAAAASPPGAGSCSPSAGPFDLAPLCHPRVHHRHHLLAHTGVMLATGGRRLAWPHLQRQRGAPRLAPCRATLDSPEIAELVDRMVAERPPPGDKEKLTRCLALIEEINSKDPSKVEFGGRRMPYRVLYGSWLGEWVEKLDPGAPDELGILARGKALESWRLSEIKRDDYSPNVPGQKQWEADRRTWLANRLKGVMKDAGYGEASQKLVEDFMLGRDLPDPRDVRLYDVTGPMSSINFRLLELLLMVQTLRDAEVLVFLERTFPRMFEELPADEVLTAVKRELAGASKKCLAAALQLPWAPLQRKLLARALPAPPGWGSVLREVEGVAAASTHPGDWRYKNFEYE